MRRNQDTPATRMAWASPQRGGKQQLQQIAAVAPPADVGSGTDYAAGSEDKLDTAGRGDETIARLLEDRMVEMAKERKQLESDMSKGVYGADALVRDRNRVVSCPVAAGAGF